MTDNKSYFDGICERFGIHNANIGGLVLGSVPEDQKTREMCMRCFNDYPSAVKYIPDKWRTKEMWLQALQKDPWMLKDIPTEYKTYQNCLNTVRKLGYMLQDVPKKWRDVKMCITSVSTEGPSGYKYIPHKIRESRQYGRLIHARAAKSDGTSFLYFPRRYKTKKNCWNAVKSYYFAFGSVPKKYQTHDLMLLATLDAWNSEGINDAVSTYPQIRTSSFVEYCAIQAALGDSNAAKVLRLKEYHDTIYADAPHVEEWKWVQD